MADRPVGYGYTAETTKKINAKYDMESTVQACDWISAILGIKLEPDEKNLQEALKDGQILCKLMNELKPNSIAKIHGDNANSFKQMENIGNFLTAAENYGCTSYDLFQSVYLLEGQNMAAVVGGIHALGRKAQLNGYAGPTLGPREATQNPREFSEEQLSEGRVHGI